MRNTGMPAPPRLRKSASRPRNSRRGASGRDAAHARIRSRQAPHAPGFRWPWGSHRRRRAGCRRAKCSQLGSYGASAILRAGDEGSVATGQPIEAHAVEMVASEQFKAPCAGIDHRLLRLGDLEEGEGGAAAVKAPPGTGGQTSETQVLNRLPLCVLWLKKKKKHNSSEA